MPFDLVLVERAEFAFVMSNKTPDRIVVPSDEGEPATIVDPITVDFGDGKGATKRSASKVRGVKDVQSPAAGKTTEAETPSSAGSEPPRRRSPPYCTTRVPLCPHREAQNRHH